MLAVATITIALCAGLLVLAAGLTANERLSVRAAKARLADYETHVLRREEALQEPFGSRVIAPLGSFFVDLARRLSPPGYIEKVRHKLVLAGRGQIEDVDKFLVLRVLSIVAIPVLGLVVWKFTSLKGLDLLAVVALVAIAGLLGPDASLNRMVADRQNAIRNKLPDILDLLTISVEAGLGFEQALARVVTLVPGPLAEEFNRMLGEMRAGSSRSDSLQALDERTQVSELRSFILALLQADTFGVSVGSILRTQAVEMRVRRRQRAQEQAQKAPVKMLFPMVFCIMPALFVVIAGPAVLGIYHAFHS